MKAIVFETYGSAEVLHLQDVPTPKPKNDEVLLKVQTSSINDWDWGLLRGVPFASRAMFGLYKPHLQILGCDVAGTVEAVGSEVTQFEVGDEVFGDLCRCRFGGFAEYTCANASALIKKPSEMSFVQAAAIPHPGVLALQALNYRGALEPGQKILFNGAGGGAGTLAVQIAKSIGAEITVVDKGIKLEMLLHLGADHVIDYQEEDFTQGGKLYDLIIDVAAYRSIFDYKRALAPGGRYAMVGGPSPKIFQLLLLGPLISITSGAKLGLMVHQPNKDLGVLVELFEAGKMSPVIDRTYPLVDTAQAMRYYAEGQAQGKVIISVAE